MKNTGGAFVSAEAVPLDGGCLVMDELILLSHATLKVSGSYGLYDAVCMSSLCDFVDRSQYVCTCSEGCIQVIQVASGGCSRFINLCTELKFFIVTSVKNLSTGI